MRWVRIKMRRAGKNISFVSQYDFDYERALDAVSIHTFHQADREWLDFVVSNRKGKTFPDDIDIYIGPAADDTIYSSIQLYETGVLDAEETIKRLKVGKLFDQITFHTETALAFCQFVKATELDMRGATMDKAKFHALMPIICAPLAEKIAQEQGLSEQQAISNLYNSLLYSYLEDEEMKVWHYSVPTLYAMYVEGETTGNIEFPDV